MHLVYLETHSLVKMQNTSDFIRKLLSESFSEKTVDICLEKSKSNNNKLGLSCAKLRAQLSSDLGLSLKLARLRAQLR